MSATPRIAMTTLLQERNSHAGNWYIHNDTYDRALIDAGALPVPVSSFVTAEVCGKYLDSVDGLLLIGGPDIPPELYGETPEPEVKPLPQETVVNHMTLIRLAFERDLPILGICLGMQELNVANGGKLIQHLGELTALHRSDAGDQYHMADLTPGSRLAEIFGCSRIEVNSAHHQAVSPEYTAPAANVAAMADGVIEAIEFPGPVFRVGVQWHPERIRDAAHRQKLFAAFVDSCRN